MKKAIRLRFAKKQRKMKCNNYNNMKHLFYPLNRSRLFFNVKDSSANLFC